MFIQAHRGNSGHAPENTLAAFKSAIEAAADGIECDIHLTGDGRFVVCHDDTIDRTSTGTGEIAAMDFEELRRHDFGVKFGEGFAGEKIPALEEMLEVVKTMRAINIEIKKFAGGTPGDPYKRLCEMLRGFGVFDKTIISSFSAEALGQMHRADSNICTAYLCSPKSGEGTIETAISLGCRAIHPHFAGIDEDYMREARAAGLIVNAWTANKPDDILFCKNMGCDAVITDEPALARTLV